ncbi:MAG TPA: type I-U CRISPR-associated helicase/endonuclease Cas3 [Candidatus Limnocylindrales bacterium]|nr:type I-U CRISPR-associated helicase/endonuclease Cas3 [Candidatus Limnocylindrales bacterium]
MAMNNVGEFAEFFSAIHGVEPFEWQLALADRVLHEGWPDAIDVPTGFGKTSVVDIAVFHLASQAGLPAAERTAPTRLFFVVDRRLIVDQTMERARRIADALTSSSESAVARVAERLRAIAEGSRPLDVVAMRGGLTWSWRWAATAHQPLVVVGTVDQFGSRLLFRGYGVGENLRSIDAAMCGTDALVIVDEAHLSVPLARTLRACVRYEALAERPVLPRRPLRLVRLSATLPADEQARDVFKPDLAVERSEAARRRFATRRVTRLASLPAAKATAEGTLASFLAEVAANRLRTGTIDRLAVVCNTVRLARLTFQEVSERLKSEADVLLLTGRVRGYERELLSRRAAGALGVASDRPPAERPVVAVATQTIEVGADFDVDALVSEAAPLDALVQRLGRLDRFGIRGEAEAIVVYVPSLHDEHVVYGDSIRRTWRWLANRRGEDPPEVTRVAQLVQSGAVDLGPRELVGLTDADRAACAGAQPGTPVVLGPLLDAWASTSPAPDPDQIVGPFLHGFDRGAPEVEVCWRSFASLDELREDLEAAPVVTEEVVAIPLRTARRFLAGLPDISLSDVEATVEAGEPETGRRAERRQATSLAALQRPDGSVVAATPETIRPGDTLVLSPEAGGHDRWGWTGGPGLVFDIADLVRRRRRVVRLLPRLLEQWTGRPADSWRALLAAPTITAPADVVTALLEEAIAAARTRPDLSALPDGTDELVGAWVEHASAMLDQLGARQARVARLGASGWIVIGWTTAPVEQGDQNETSSSGAPIPVGLRKHLLDVADRSGSYARALGLAEDLVATTEFAGLAHDLGKADPRFQLMLCGGDFDRYEAAAELLAKSGMVPTDRRAFQEARRRSGYPAGGRHEALSAALLREAMARDDRLRASIDAELALHLVAVHHGRSRPLLPPVPDPDPRTVAVDLAQLWPADRASVGRVEVSSAEAVVDWTQPRRFRRLSARYGRWGLALLESIVRLADISCSEEYRA